jgi:RNA polymerase sigma factor (sigma-70 family)
MSDRDQLDLDSLVQEQLPALRGFLASLGAHTDLIDDLAQEVFVQVIEQRGNYDPSRPFRSWLFGVARNLLYQEYRKTRTHARVRQGLAAQVLFDHAEEDPAAELMKAETAERLEGCLGELSARGRELLVLRFGELLSGMEIGRRLGMGHGAVRMGLLRARSSLRHCLEHRLQGEAP